MHTLYALILVLTFNGSADTADKNQWNVIDQNLTVTDCLSRVSARVIVHKDSFVTVTSETTCKPMSELAPIKPVQASPE